LLAAAVHACGKKKLHLPTNCHLALGARKMFQTTCNLCCSQKWADAIQLDVLFQMESCQLSEKRCESIIGAGLNKAAN